MKTIHFKQANLDLINTVEIDASNLPYDVYIYKNLIDFWGSSTELVPMEAIENIITITNDLSIIIASE